jgi:hypothetical protein
MSAASDETDMTGNMGNMDNSGNMDNIGNIDNTDNNMVQTLQDDVTAAGDAFQHEDTSTPSDAQVFDDTRHTHASDTREPVTFYEGQAPNDSQTQQAPQHAPQPQHAYPPNIGPRRLGIVTSYHARKGWGFVRDMYTQEVFFAYHTEVMPFWPDDRIGSNTMRNFKNCLHTGEYVEFGVGINLSTGEECAKHVTGLCGYTLQMDWATIRYIRTRDSRTYEISSDVVNTFNDSRTDGHSNSQSDAQSFDNMNSDGQHLKQQNRNQQRNQQSHNRQRNHQNRNQQRNHQNRNQQNCNHQNRNQQNRNQRTREYGSTTIQQHQQQTRRRTPPPPAHSQQQTASTDATPSAATAQTTATHGISTVPTGWE